MPKSLLCNGCALFEAPMAKNSFSITTDLPPVIDLLVIGAFPMPEDITRGCFMSRDGKLIRSIIQRHIAHKYAPLKISPKVIYTFATKCCPEKQEYKINIETINKCSTSFLHEYIQLTNPSAILTLGVQAAKAVGLKETIGALRGKNHLVKINGKDYNVLPTFHPSEMYKKQGKLPLMRGDIHKAIAIATNKYFTVENYDIRTPTTAEDIVKELNELYEYCKKNHEENGTPVILAVDTETTSLIPWDPTSRMIAVSMSHKNNYGLSFPWQHRDNPFTEEEFSLIKEALNKLLSSPYVKITGHNDKFDYKWLVLKYALSMPSFYWDSMLGEHLLNEDKTGFYGLKALVIEYFPEFADYEKELKLLLKAKQLEINERYNKIFKDSLTKWKEDILKVFLDFSSDERSRFVAAAVTKGSITLDNGSELITPSTKTNKNGTVTYLKKYVTKVKVLLNKIILSDKNSSPIPRPEPPEIPDVTFEDIDLLSLLKYAALDALCSRKLMGLQTQGFREDSEIIRQSQQVIDSKFRYKINIATRPLSWCMHNITMPASTVLTEMEYFGVKLDIPKIKEYIGILDGHITNVEETMYKYAGYKFNPDASADLIKILYNELNYPIIARSAKTNAPSTDADTLEELNFQKQNLFLESLLSYRKLTKCRNTYLRGWIKKSKLDGKLHCNYNLNGTATGRLSSSGPNL